MPDVTFAIAGNPNCGKTTLFNALTGGRQRVGNWPGVTVERKESRYRHNDVAYTVVDLPGIYSLDVISDGTSLDEKIARDYLLSGEPDLIVNIIDASNLERNLYLTVQLMEMRLPLVLALNMMDIAQDRGVRIAPAVLAQKLGCPVIPLVASKGQGLEALKDMVAHAAAERQVPTVIVPYRPVVEDVIHDLTTSLEARLSHTSVDARWVAVKLLEGDELAQQLAGDGLQTLLPTQVERIETVVREDIDTIFADSRYGFVNTLTQDAVAAGTRAARNLSDKIDRVVLHRMLGIPIFLVLMYLMFMRTINVGSAFIDFFDILVGTLLVDGFRTLLTLVSSPAWLTTLLADGSVVVCRSWPPSSRFSVSSSCASPC